jgi:mannose-6-phosphate isomerase-like protein (cupin superfamily)
MVVGLTTVRLRLAPCEGDLRGDSSTTAGRRPTPRSSARSKKTIAASLTGRQDAGRGMETRLTVSETGSRVVTEKIDPSEKINLSEKLALFEELWTPKIIAQLNGQHVKLAKVQGEMVWHELFLVLSGRLTLHLRDRSVVLGPGELFVVPRGVEHLPVAEEETHLLLFEPVTTAHTGDTITEMTVTELEWI